MSESKDAERLPRMFRGSADLIERQAKAVALLDAILDAKSPSDQVVALKAARAERALTKQ